MRHNGGIHLMVLSRSATAVAAFAILVTCALVDGARADPAPTLLWKRHPGTAMPDAAWGVATDGAGNVVIAGHTYGSLAAPNKGHDDAFVVKYSPDGTLKWRRQLGSWNRDLAFGVAADAAGNVVIAGYTRGSLVGPKKGGLDGFVAKYAPDGTVQWKRQLGTTQDDAALAVAIDAVGNIVIAGVTDADAFVMKYAPDGTVQWRRRLGSTEYDVAYGVAIDAAGNIVVVGLTDGSLGGPNKGDADAFVAAIHSDGTLQWTLQPGTTGFDLAFGVATDAAGNVFVAGQQPGPNGTDRAFVAAYSRDGTEQWRRQLGGDYFDAAYGVAIDLAGNVVIAGQQFRHPFAASFSSEGTLQWTQQVETLSDYRVVPATDAAGDVVIAGTIYVGGHRRYSDAFVAKYAPPGP
jgi:hypothetical protein